MGGLRDYQADLLDRARARIRERVRRLLLQLPTGGGKTVVAAEMLGGAAKRGKRAWFVVHRKELLEQTSRTFLRSGIPHGFIAADFAANSFEHVQLCGIATLRRRLDEVAAPDVIVWDEAHHCVAGDWSQVAERFPDAVHVGLTATPQRLDGRGLKDHFDELICGPTVKQLIEAGHLSRYRYFAPGQPDLAGCRSVGGDFNRGDLTKIMGDEKLIGDMVAHYQRLAAGLQGITFAVDIDHSRSIATAFAAAGIRAEHVDGTMHKNRRRDIIEAFRAGDLDLLSNCELFGEGFDVPNVSYVGLARPSKSLTLFRQQVGRALRVLPGKDHAVICDHAGNAFTHGMPDDDIVWTLEGRKKSTRGPTGPNDALSIRQCAECYQVSASSVDVCPGCGTPFPARERPKHFADGELFELQKMAAKKEATERRKAEERACRSVADFIQLAVTRGYNNPRGWAMHQVSMRSAYKSRFQRRSA